MRARSVLGGAIAAMLVPAMALAYTSVFRSAYTDMGDSYATGVATGDYDGDGWLDAATCSAGSNNRLSVFYGFNDGEISNAGNSVPLGSIPTGMVQGDFDGDGLVDLVISKGSEDAVVFLKGRGDIDFFEAPGSPIGAGQNPAGLAAADLDGDEILDLVVANESSDGAPGSVSILRGNGDGGFVRLQQPDPDNPGGSVDDLPAQLGTRAVAVGNIDADPALDVLALNTRSNSISVFTGDGNGTFTAHGTLPSGAGALDLALADTDGDGLRDLIVAVSNDDAVTVALGNGDRSFGTPYSYPVGTAPNRLVVADLDGDGPIDIIASNSRSGDVSVLHGRNGGTLAAARTFVADAEPQALALGDFNDDQLLDVVAATQGSNSGATLAVLRSDGAGVLHGVEDVPVGGAPADLAGADVDGDGVADVVVSDGSGRVSVFPGGSTGFGTPRRLDSGGQARGVAVGLLNGDTFPDIAVADSDRDGVVLFLSNAYGRLAAPVFYPTAHGPSRLAIGDFNGDGRPDIAASTVGADRKCLGGTKPGQSCVWDNDCGAGGVCSAPGKASVLLQKSNGTYGTPQDTSVEETPVGIAAMDANCDGKDDLVVANLASSTVSVLRSQGNGSFTLAQTLGESAVGKNPMALAVADFNRDGVADFVVTNTVAAAGVANIHLFKGACGGAFTQINNTPPLRVELANAVVARDFTGDQLVDLAVSSQTGNEVYLAVGKGDGTMQAPYSDKVSRMPIAVAAGDFDGDGRYDAVSANSDPSANNLSVLTNCARDAGCRYLAGPEAPPGSSALRGDGNKDGRRSAADFVAAAREIGDGDGTQVEAIGRGSYAAAPGVDANGDGRVDRQDRVGLAHRIFGGA